MLYNNHCPILMRRFSNNSTCTRGELMFHTTKFQTLEPSKVVIPDGHYFIRLSYSPTFSKKYPYVANLDGRVPEIMVEGHSGLRIHVGNYPSDTRGCILIGEQGTDSCVINSSLAYRKFCAIISELQVDNPNVFFTIKIFSEYD